MRSNASITILVLRYIGQHVEPADQVELLENHGRARPPLPQILAAQRGDIDAFEQDAALGRIGEAVDHPQQGRFAGAGATDHADEAARRDRERSIVDRGFRAETARQTFHHQHATLQAQS
jgi:hypothetical protein